MALDPKRAQTVLSALARKMKTRLGYKEPDHVRAKKVENIVAILNTLREGTRWGLPGVFAGATMGGVPGAIGVGGLAAGLGGSLGHWLGKTVVRGHYATKAKQIAAHNAALRAKHRKRALMGGAGLGAAGGAGLLLSKKKSAVK